MKTTYLLPHKYKILGWVLLTLGILTYITSYISDYGSDFFKIKVLSLFNSGIDFSGEGGSFFKIIKNNILDEIISILIIIGGLLIGFTREEIEDEFIHKLRHESLVWAIIVNYTILIFTIIFIYDMAFFNVMTYNMVTPLLFFIIRFNFLKLKSRSDEE